MPYLKEFQKFKGEFPDDDFRGLRFKSKNENENKILCHITLSAREKRNNFLEIFNGEVIEKCEAYLIGKIWREMDQVYPSCRFCDYYFESDSFHGIIELPNIKKIHPSKLIPKAISELKSRSTQVLNHYHSQFSRIFWENSYNQILFENGSGNRNAFYFLWKNPA